MSRSRDAQPSTAPSQFDALRAPSAGSGVGTKLNKELSSALVSLRKWNAEQTGSDQQVGNLLYYEGMRISRELASRSDGAHLAQAQRLLRTVHEFNNRCRQNQSGPRSDDLLAVTMPPKPEPSTGEA